MRFGIKKTNNGLTCVNCGRELGKKLTTEVNYCTECGAPLKPESYEEFIYREKRAQLRVILTIEDALKKYTVKKILTDLKQDIEQDLI